MKFIYNEKGNSRKSGVYKIINTKNGRIYIGSAKEFKRRGKQHLHSLKNNIHRNQFLQSDFNKCGEDAFEFHVLEVVEGKQKARLIVEQKYLDKHFDNQKKCYNFTKSTKATGRSCYSKDPQITLEKRKQTMLEKYGVEYYCQTEEARKEASKRMTGFKFSPEAIEKSASKRRGREWSKNERKIRIAIINTPEFKQKQSKALKKSAKKRWQDPEYREKMSKVYAKTTTETWKNPEFRQKRSDGIKKAMATDEYKEKKSKSNKEAWAKDDGTRREQVSKQSKKLWADPEYRAKKLSQITGRKNTEEQKKRMSQAAFNRAPDTEETKRIKSEAAKKRFQDPKQREFLAKLSRNRASLSAEARKKISEAHKGRKCKEETKRKISLAHKGRKLSPERREQCREAGAKKIYNLIIISPTGEEFLLEKNAAAFCREHNINKNGMWRILSGKTKDYLGWKIKPPTT
jgi:group I intron endonuclease